MPGGTVMSEERVAQSKDRSGRARALTCAGCDKRIECCCFCDRPDCATAVCYPCVAVDLKESMPVLHGHGG
jgi:hypothetical protein